ncbi:phosphohexomutase domain-containing protein [Psychrobacter namhaensis]|uniref:phosphomannomutase n=1 Tax=Psychrobacter namhaensis TaxID=292734 RepID=UPI0018DF923D|nr:phosphomannomutase [Psychrobacter namhaensis]
MPSFAAQQCLFRAYDIRGSRQHFTARFVTALGLAFAELYHQQNCGSKDVSANSRSLTPTVGSKTVHSKTINSKRTIIVIGYDVRCGSDVIAHRLADILTQHGLHVVQLNLVTTPMMVFWAEQYQGHGIIVTASHSAKDILGIKWLIDHRSPSGTDIQMLYQQLVDSAAHHPSDKQKVKLEHRTPCIDTAVPVTGHQTVLPHEQVATAYIDAIAQVFEQIYPIHKQHPKDTYYSSAKLDLVVVIDCMHGATSNVAQRLFERFCRQVIMLNDTPDGNFPAGNPDPTEPHRLIPLQQSVVAHQADIGIAFDGDGDRLMVVDNNGKVVMPDHLLYLLAQVALSACPDALADSQLTSQILFDIKCSHHLPKLLSELGTVPVVSKTGSSFMRQQMQQSPSQIIFAGEFSGHFIFNDRRFIVYDDAMYAALRLLHWLSAADEHGGKKVLADITHTLPDMVSTADHYLPVPKTRPTDCSIIEQLARLCQYLRQLVEAAQSVDSSHDFDLLNACSPPLCHCSAHRQHLTLEQARRLLPVGTKLSCIDGVRLDFAHGFGVVRQSNTSHHLTARFAGNSLTDLKAVQATFATLCRPFDKKLAEQIVAIPAE